MKKRWKKIIVGIFVGIGVAVAMVCTIGLLRRAETKEKIQSYNQEQETNADGIVLDLAENPYYDKKQWGYTYPMPDTITYYSDITDTKRHAMVYLPADYDKDKEYPVLYLLHGLDGSHRTWYNKSAHIIIQNLYYFEDVPEMIVVCPNSAVNSKEDTDDLGISEKIKAYDLTGDDLVKNLMPYIEEHYPVKTGPENTAIAGNSMGGRNTMYTAYTYPELFGYVGVFSAANVLPREGYNGVMTPLLEDLSVDTDFELLMLAVGKSDDVCGSVTYRLHELMNEKGIEHIFYDMEGGHSNVVFCNALYNFAKKIFR